MRMFWALVLLVLAGLFGWGCSKNADINYRDTLATLERGEARGHLVLTVGGSPLSVGMKQVFFAGPENGAFAFDGDVDFKTDKPTALSDEQPE